jgi:UDP-4-amino-4-deoxy-L-arabinose formyltransferase/UDP-glucuronic acid dehydrogenase (UDP-4-keto-hexauronic acid decarboxylating)
VTQFIANLFMGEPIQLVDGGRQRRCFTYVDDGISALMNILENRNGCAAGKIFNVGNPKNDCSIRDLAHQLRDLYSRHPGARKRIPEIVEVDSKQFYGEGYQDIQTRTPSIERARQCLGWSPKVGLREALAKTLDAFLEENEPPKRRRGRGSPAVAGRGHS